MIDWVSAVIPCIHDRIPRGQVIKFTHEGELERRFETTRRFNGSYESKMAAVSNFSSDTGLPNGQADLLFIDGNPAKFLQGHNIIGSDNLNELVLAVVTRLFEIIEQPLPLATIGAIKKGQYKLKRIDITYYYDVGSHYNVNQFIDAIAKKSRTRSGRSTKVKGTTYINKHSRYWAMKFYSKFDEIHYGGKGHDIPKHFYDTPLIEFCREKVRAELVLRKMELVRIAQQQDQYTNDCYAYHITDRLNDLYNEYVRKIDMSAQMNVATKDEEDLSRAARCTYLLWKAGHDLYETVPSTTFYRHKKEIKELLDIDISLPPVNRDDVSHNVIPLLNVIEAQRAEIPNNILPFIYNVG